MNSNFRPLTMQEKLDQEKEDQMIYKEIMQPSRKEKQKLSSELTKELDYLLTQMEQLPSSTTPTDNQQTQSESPINLQLLEQLTPSLPPQIQQILDMVIPLLDSESTLTDLVSMMNSRMEGETIDSATLDLLKQLFQ